MTIFDLEVNHATLNLALPDRKWLEKSKNDRRVTKEKTPVLRCIAVPRDATSLRLDGVAGSLPKAAPQTGQPWALRQNPDGIRDEPIPTGLCHIA